ncbi:P-loop containing nucleoside triphosphate hydrolase protein [Biscogniauxia sp. FL1348]|nr:P-loop containing nucleoside triphosphate hydrolase protein [Biscogniauxia sp. FL1348]
MARKQAGEESSASMAAKFAEQISQKASGFIQSSNHRDLLDIVDSLRSHGVSHYVDLPQIIVCGSQSSGKSSTLESLSGIAFPTAEGLCTRFATELVLRRGEKSEIKVHIQPAKGRTEEEREKLAAFVAQTSEEDDFPKLIESAKQAMGLTGTDGSKMFSTDVLRVESTSPLAPNLTIVDLPGLFGAPDKNQSEDDSKLVENLVLSYMRQTRSIILAVVSADNPFANQPVTKFARKIDPTGLRTLGLITKPDKVDVGSESEKYYIELAQNMNVKMNLGWHILRNRGHNTATDTAEERDKREAEFFKNSVWNILDPSQLGVEALRGRLRDILWKQIHNGLPGVKTEVQAGIRDCMNKLGQLGKARSSQREKHTYLQRISSRLSKLTRAAIDGVYSDRYFESYPGQQDAFERRLRAHVQLILTQYSESMRTHGHALEIVDDGLKPTRKSPSKYVMRADYLEEVKKLMVECRGRELPGTFNPLVVGDLFSRQCKPWEAITQNLVERIHDAAASTFNNIISDICDQNTKTRLIKWHIQPALYRLRKDLKSKVDELLEPHLSVHPITYNDYLTQKVQVIQTMRHKRKFDALSLKACNFTAETVTGTLSAETISTLLITLRQGTCPNVEEYSASLASDVSEAYYQVAIKKFVDDISVNAIETCLIQRLPDVFSPDVVWDLDEKAVERLGSEDESAIKERIDATTKLNILETGLKDLDAFTSRTSAQAAIAA